MAFPNAQNVDARYSSFQEIHGIVYVDHQETTKANQIYQWLSAPDCSSNQHDAYKKRQTSTNAWFIDGKPFSDWKNNPKSFILLHGIGKYLLPPSPSFSRLIKY
jgi:hypothetical protein